MKEQRDAYEAFIAGFTTGHATDIAELRSLVEDSARVNTDDTFGDEGREPVENAEWYERALDNARMIADCWEDFYPELVDVAAKDAAEVSS